MDTFIHDIFIFPTIIYTGLLALVVFYWFVASLGLIELDAMLNYKSTSKKHRPHFFVAGLQLFGLTGIPLSMIFSLIILFSWCLCFIAVHFIYPYLPLLWVQVLIGCWLALIIPVLVAVLISPLLQPFKVLFIEQQGIAACHFVGRQATVRSHKVTAVFGQADCSDGGAGLIVQIRAIAPNAIQRGDTVLLQQYDAKRNVYQVGKIKAKNIRS